MSAGFSADLPLKVYAIYDPAKLGEVAMVNAVSNEIKATRPTAQIDNKPNATFSELDLTDQAVIVTVGQFGINFLKSQEIPTHVKVLLCTHQWFDSMNELHNIYITMPEHAITEAIRSIATANHLMLLPTQGVLHTMSKEALATEDSSAVALRDAKIGVVLGGDAELPDGSWKVFSTENARKLAEEVVKLQRETGCDLLITNGPRTGKSLTAHSNGESDLVSSAFLETLQAKGLVKDRDFEFFDFQFGQPSALKAIIKVVSDNEGFMIIPGESTTSISEILAVAPAAIYKNDAMNETHVLFVDQLVRANLAILWPQAPEIMRAYVPLPRQEVAVVREFLK